ncbi:MAG: galactose/methyl galactoside ABC transporter permease MglC [Lachnospiraceae bacterium]|nr:galactose/methyl galactoside ABC transporter permease MglC [Lachnospiraceae bacterium]
MTKLKNLVPDMQKRSWKSILLDWSIYIVLLILVLVIIYIDPKFLSLKNASAILSQASTRIILALGVSGIIVLGCTDLSLGRSVGMAAIFTASFLQDPSYGSRVFPNLPELPLIIPILGAIALCASFSLVHGFFVAKLKVAPFIASLGMQLVIYGLMSIYFDVVNDSAPIGVLNPKLSKLAQGAFHIGTIRIPYLVCYAVIAIVVIWFIWNKTVLGRNMFAIGGNSEAANVSGINIIRNMLIIYVIAGIMYGIGGALEVARTGSATNALGQSYELDAIASCVVGGVSMRGGVGSIGGVVTGVLLFQIISYGLVFAQVNPYLQYFVKGAIILLAVSVDTQKYIKKK